MSKYSRYIGIDVSKDTLDLCIFDGKEYYYAKIENNVPALSLLFKTEPVFSKLKLRKTLICFEHMGFYNNHLCTYLEKRKAHFTMQSPLHIKLSIGLVRDKSDKLDAQRIALFAAKNADGIKLWTRPRSVILQLQYLYSLRRRLIVIKSMLQVPIAIGKRFLTSDVSCFQIESCTASCQSVRKDIKSAELMINSLIQEDQRLKQLYDIIITVPYVGPVIATNLIIITNEFKNFESANQLACHAGIAPFQRSSGTSLKGRSKVSFYANKEIKSLLHLSVLCSIRFPGELRNYYLRKTKEGKHPMVVLNAMKNKLVRWIFTCVKEERIFLKNRSSS